MKLTEKGFTLLTYLERNKQSRFSQKQLAGILNISVGMINKLVNEFLDEGILSSEHGLEITEKGLDLLEPYRVRRAIILAAGFSERLAPITLTTPKPLVKVKGVRIVDTLIDALIAAEIDDITVVVGYRADSFDSLKKKYPQVRLVVNDLYNEGGNIMSLYAARDKLDSCLICDADLYVHNPAVIGKYEYSSCFFGYPVFGTDDWCFSVTGKKIKNLQVGGELCYKTVFLTYLDGRDSEKCRTDIENLIRTRGGKEHHWFDVLRNGYRLGIKECFSDDVSEVDTIGDLIKLDDSYYGTEL